MNIIEEFERISRFYIDEYVSYFVKGPTPMTVAKAKGWAKFVKGEKRKRYDIWVISYANGEKELYLHLSGCKPVKQPNPSVADIINAFEKAEAKKRHDVVLDRSVPKAVLYEQLTLF